MAVLFDVIILAIVLLCIAFSAHRGFVRAVLETTGGMISAFFAYLFAKPAGRWLSEKFLRAFVENKITEKLLNITGQTADTPIETVDLTQTLKEAPDAFRSLLRAVNVNLDKVRGAVGEGQTVAEKSRAVVEELSASVSVTLSVCLCFAVFFCLFMITVSLLAKLAGGLSYIPVVGKFNRVLGALFGMGKAVVMVCVFTAMLRLLLPYLTEPMNLNPDDPYDGTVLCGVISDYNPLIKLLPTDFVKEG